jgi:hypothetical protein
VRQAHAESAREKLSILGQGTLAQADRVDLAGDVERLLAAMVWTASIPRWLVR